MWGRFDQGAATAKLIRARPTLGSPFAMYLILSVTNMLTLNFLRALTNWWHQCFLALFPFQTCAKFNMMILPIHLSRSRTTKKRQFVYARRWYKSSPLPHRTNRSKGAAGKDGTKAFWCHVQDLERLGKIWKRPFWRRHLQILPSSVRHGFLNFGCTRSVMHIVRSWRNWSWR